jgi:hypothetical protein
MPADVYDERRATAVGHNVKLGEHQHRNDLDSRMAIVVEGYVTLRGDNSDSIG